MEGRAELLDEFERIERSSLRKPEIFLGWLRRKAGDPPSRRALAELAFRKLRRVPLAVRDVEETAYWPGVLLTLARVMGNDIAACISEDWTDPTHVPAVHPVETSALWSVLIVARRYCPVLWTRFCREYWTERVRMAMETDAAAALSVRPWRLHSRHRLRELADAYGVELLADLFGFAEERLRDILEGEDVEPHEGWRIGVLSRVLPADPALFGLQVREMRQADSTTGGE